MGFMRVTVDNGSTQTDRDFHETYQNSCIMYKNRYTAKLPWKNDFQDLATNYNITKHRTENII